MTWWSCYDTHASRMCRKRPKTAISPLGQHFGRTPQPPTPSTCSLPRMAGPHSIAKPHTAPITPPLGPHPNPQQLKRPKRPQTAIPPLGRDFGRIPQSHTAPTCALKHTTCSHHIVGPLATRESPRGGLHVALEQPAALHPVGPRGDFQHLGRDALVGLDGLSDALPRPRRGQWVPWAALELRAGQRLHMRARGGLGQLASPAPARRQTYLLRGARVDHEFDPLLPTVIMMRNGILLGVASRRNIGEKLLPQSGGSRERRPVRQRPSGRRRGLRARHLAHSAGRAHARRRRRIRTGSRPIWPRQIDSRGLVRHHAVATRGRRMRHGGVVCAQLNSRQGLSRVAGGPLRGLDP